MIPTTDLPVLAGLGEDVKRFDFYQALDAVCHAGPSVAAMVENS